MAVTYTEAGAIYELFLKCKSLPVNYSLEECARAYFHDKSRDFSKMDGALEDINNKIKEAIDAGKEGIEISNFLYKKDIDLAKAARTPEVNTISITENGKTTGVNIETVAFDPSGKSNVNAYDGSVGFQFGDSSTENYDPAREEAYANMAIAARGADNNKSEVGTYDKIDTPERFIIGDGPEQLPTGVDSQNVPSFGETSAPASMDNPGSSSNFIFGDDDNNGPSNDQGLDGGLRF